MRLSLNRVAWCGFWASAQDKKSKNQEGKFFDLLAFAWSNLGLVARNVISLDSKLNYNDGELSTWVFGSPA
jgi:hypothetical protein